MTTKHAPGPWRWGDHFLGLYSSASGKEEGDVLTWRPYENMWLTFCESREANARLIAAAPELLEALRIVRDTLPHINGNASSVNSLLKLTGAAIAKATGEQQ